MRLPRPALHLHNAINLRCTPSTLMPTPVNPASPSTPATTAKYKCVLSPCLSAYRLYQTSPVSWARYISLPQPLLSISMQMYSYRTDMTMPMKLWMGYCSRYSSLGEPALEIVLSCSCEDSSSGIVPELQQQANTQSSPKLIISTMYSLAMSSSTYTSQRTKICSCRYTQARQNRPSIRPAVRVVSREQLRVKDYGCRSRDRAISRDTATVRGRRGERGRLGCQYWTRCMPRRVARVGSRVRTWPRCSRARVQLKQSRDLMTAGTSRVPMLILSSSSPSPLPSFFILSACLPSLPRFCPLPSLPWLRCLQPQLTATTPFPTYNAPNKYNTSTSVSTTTYCIITSQQISSSPAIL